MPDTVDTTARAWKVNRDASGGVFIDEGKAVLAGDNQNFIVADQRGITFKGPVSYVSMSSEQRYGGLWLGVGEFMDMIPATIVTINPRKIPAPPVTGLANITKDVAYFMSLLSDIVSPPVPPNTSGQFSQSSSSLFGLVTTTKTAEGAGTGG